MTLTYTIEPRGKKFATVCRDDGFWSITFLSKNKRMARQKGEDFLSGKRTCMGRYTTPFGRLLNEQKSREKRAVPAVVMGALLFSRPRAEGGE